MGRHLARLICLVVALPVLAALIVAFNQETAVSRGPDNLPQLRAAWDRLNAAEASSSALEDAESQARAVLRREPLNANAVSLISAVREKQGRLEEGEALARLAFRLNHREDFANLLLYRHAMARSDYEAAFLHADALLRRRFGFTEELYPTMAPALADSRAVEALAKRLVKRPDWRRHFMPAYINGHASPGGAFALIDAIRSAGGSPTTDEISIYLSRLFAEGRIEEAYLTWILFLPDRYADQLGLVYDGDFDGWPDAPPFTWRLGSAGIDTPPDRPASDQALYVRYDGGAARQLPQQILALPPGRYRLSGEALAESRPEAGSLRWTIRCLPGQEEVLGRSSPPAARQWTSFATTFAVPSRCPAQQLVLEGLARDEITAVEAWFDKLAIAPVREATP